MRNDDPLPGASTSVDNALRLLLLIGDRQVVRVAEAAELLGVARSTAHRLLKAMRRRGFVEQQHANGPYRVGPALRALGLTAITRVDVRSVARPALEAVFAATGETTSVALLEGSTARFVDCIESTRTVRVAVRTGLVMGAHCTAVGKALLAQLPSHELDLRYPDHVLPGRTDASITSWPDLLADLELVRRNGYAVNTGESNDGVRAVAVPLHDPTGRHHAGIGVAMPADRLPDVHSERRLAGVLADAVRRALGEPPADVSHG